MMRLLAPLLFGLVGAGILISLGVWQFQRLAWKEGVLAEIESRIAAAPSKLPLIPDVNDDLYKSVAVTGQFGTGALKVLVSRKRIGAGHLIVSPFITDTGRVILVDRGFLKLDDALQGAPKGLVSLAGNLLWPDDRNSATPDNDIEGNIWFARDLPQMAEMFGAEQTLLVVRDMSQSDRAVTPLPVDTTHIPNDHLQYAVTWFSLAFIWLVMTGYYIIKNRTPSRGASS